MSFRVVPDGAPQTEPRVVWVTMAGLLSVTMLAADDVPPVALTPLPLAYIRALHATITTEDVGLLLEAGQAHNCDVSTSLP